MPGYREAGSYAQNPRGPGGLVHVTLDARELIRVTARARGEAAKLTAATKVAHEELARKLQRDISDVLTSKVSARGRAQRSKPEQSRLGRAIRSSANRRVNVHGYTVGYLDEIAAVRPYYRGLEEGSRKHVGRFLSGVFTTDGVASRLAQVPLASAPGFDAQFRQRRRYSYERAFFPGVRIKRPIQGYHYFAGGQANFISRGGTTTLARAAYVNAFRAHGDLLSRALNLDSTGLPTRTGLSISQGDQRSSDR